MVDKLLYPEQNELLRMPVSVNSWIVLKDYAYHFGNLEIFQKMIGDYLEDCPLFELDQILKIAKNFLCEKDFQSLMIFLFKCCHLIHNDADGIFDI